MRSRRSRSSSGYAASASRHYRGSPAAAMPLSRRRPAAPRAHRRGPIERSARFTGSSRHCPSGRAGATRHHGQRVRREALPRTGCHATPTDWRRRIWWIAGRAPTRSRSRPLPGGVRCRCLRGSADQVDQRQSAARQPAVTATTWRLSPATTEPPAAGRSEHHTKPAARRTARDDHRSRSTGPIAIHSLPAKDEHGDTVRTSMVVVVHRAPITRQARWRVSRWPCKRRRPSPGRPGDP
jgi:hypothetical protein